MSIICAKGEAKLGLVYGLDPNSPEFIGMQQIFDAYEATLHSLPKEALLCPLKNLLAHQNQGEALKPLAMSPEIEMLLPEFEQEKRLGLLIYVHFSKAEITQTLHDYRDKNLPPIQYKAALTRENQHWPLIKLLHELSIEHRFVYALRRLQGQHSISLEAFKESDYPEDVFAPLKRCQIAITNYFANLALLTQAPNSEPAPDEPVLLNRRLHQAMRGVVAYEELLKSLSLSEDVIYKLEREAVTKTWLFAVYLDLWQKLSAKDLDERLRKQLHLPPALPYEKVKEDLQQRLADIIQDKTFTGVEDEHTQDMLFKRIKRHIEEHLVNAQLEKLLGKHPSPDSEDGLSQMKPPQV